MVSEVTIFAVSTFILPLTNKRRCYYLIQSHQERVQSSHEPTATDVTIGREAIVPAG